MVLFLVVISLIVFLPELLDTPPKPPKVVSFKSPNVDVDLRVLESNNIKNLELFHSLDIAFEYVVFDSTGKEITGNISAADKRAAEASLKNSGFTIVTLKEMGVGRENPFVSY